MTVPRNVLLVDPVMVSHSLLYYEAALMSSGFESAEFTIATAIFRPGDRQRLTEFSHSHPRMKLQILEVPVGACLTRWDCWRSFGRSMRAAEQILQAQPFDLVAYLSLDLVLVYFALPAFRRKIHAHFQTRIAGTLFRDNGLRPPVEPGLKGRARGLTDLWILRRALQSGGVRKAAFLDHWCADRARELLHVANCGYGVDPVFPETRDPAAARAALGVRADEYAFLLFGMLSDRKGVLESLAMLREAPLPPHKTVVIVAGPSVPEFRVRLDEELAATSRKYRVIRHDRFIERPEMPAYFAASDCVICLYKDFTGSSNVLLHAATHGKPALVCPGGAMEDAVRRHRFGEVVRLDDSEGFSAAVCRLVALDGPARQAMARGAVAYGASMDARRFMAQYV